MKKIHIFSLTALAFLASAIIFTACVKKTADIPVDAANYDPGYPAGTRGTIKDIKSKHIGAPVQITEDLVISAIVTADDRGGNFYKNIMIQDSTTGINLLIERSGLYTDFPVGRRIYIKAKGLWVSAYGQFKQLGYALDQTNALVGIPANQINNFIVKSIYRPNDVPVKKVSVFELRNGLNSDLMGMLVQIDSNAQFTDPMLGLTYAQPSWQSSGTDRYIEECGNASSIVLRTSGYARFQNEPIPSGRGTLTAIFSRYNNTAQLLIRDLNDVKFTDSVRCNGVVAQPPTDITIKQLRELYNGTGVKLGNLQIHGVITTSIPDSNIASSNYFMQDESGRGINIFASGQSLSLGDSVTIRLNNDSLIVYRGNLEIKNGVTPNVLVFNTVASNKNVTATPVTIAQLNSDLTNPSFKDRVYECTVVKLANGTFTSATNLLYGGLSGNTITDATGSMVQYCRNNRPWNITPLPTGNVYTSLTGIAANFNTTPQILVRKLSDIN
jgi:hypothetical protein